jgi:7,8-dihydropterin-6-yl-methyl-4-(beta-D-ribofuranosyl)aminobenzene 5'-phosphate synthase
LAQTAVRGETRHTVLFDTAPEEHIWELNAKRLRAKIANVEWIQLSHWHRDHSGGMLKAISMINEAKGTKTIPVDLHPSRPTYRGIQGPFGPVSLEADPTFEEIEAAGGQVLKNDQPHAILDDSFLVSGEIPRVTPYEVGLARAIRFYPESGKWESDEQIADERFLMCNVKGACSGEDVVALPADLSIRQGCRGLHRLFSRWRGQRRQARAAIGR